MGNTDHRHDTHLTHDMPCQRCGHAIHTFLACSDTCPCVGAAMPGTNSLASDRVPDLVTSVLAAR